MIKPLHKMSLKDRVEELLNDEPKTLFRILQLLPSTEDGCPCEEESELLNRLHSAKFAIVSVKKSG